MLLSLCYYTLCARCIGHTRAASSSRLFSSTIQSPLSLLNDDQRLAAGAPIHGAVLCSSGPGSGKTRVLVSRIAYLIGKCEQSPSSVLALTFTNKAAKEMRDRVALMVGDNANDVTMGTFHSLCSTFLRRYGGDYLSAFGMNRNYTIYDDDDLLRVTKALIKKYDVDITPADLLEALKARKRAKALPNEDLGKMSPSQDLASHIVDKVWVSYIMATQGSNALDFDDLITLTLKMLRDSPRVRANVHRKYRHILVDEYQDTDIIQAKLLLELAPPSMLTSDFTTVEVGSERSLFVVGDPNQAIYGFRGAAKDSMSALKSFYPSILTVINSLNYRSTPRIVTAANQILGKEGTLVLNSAGESVDHPPVQVIYTDDKYTEAEFVARLAESSLKKGETLAVMYRLNMQSRCIEQELIKKGLRYRVYGGLDFFSRLEIKDMLCYLRLFANPADRIAFARVVNVPKRGIGEKTVGEFFNWVDASMSLSVRFGYKPADLVSHLAYLLDTNLAVSRMQIQKVAMAGGAGDALVDTEPLSGCSGQTLLAPCTMSDRAKKAMIEFADVMCDLYGVWRLQEKTLPIFFDYMVQKLRYIESIVDNTKDRVDQKLMREENLNSLSTILMKHQKKEVDGDDKDVEISVKMTAAEELSRFLDFTSLSIAEDDDGVEDTSMVSLLSIHRSKGLEFDTVVVCGCHDGNMPLLYFRDVDIDEERRLAYVAATRARRKLIFIAYGGMISRFLNDLEDCYKTRD